MAPPNRTAKQVEADGAENHLPGGDEFEAGQDVAEA